MPQLTRIALVVDKRTSFWRSVMRGVISFARPGRPWTFHSILPWDTVAVPWMENWSPAGVIGSFAQPAIADFVRRRNLPAVHVGEEADLAGAASQASIDFEAVGAMAARHFLDKGIDHFGMFGYWTMANYPIVRDGFARAVQASGRARSFSEFKQLTSSSNGWEQNDQQIAQWLESLPKPVGILLSEDDCGLWISQMCEIAGLRVPEEVALLGVNDDALDCRLCSPPLSSIALPTERLGYTAASMLDAAMAGKQVQQPSVRLGPLHIVPRESTDVLAIDDTELAAAVRYIRSNAGQPLRVEDVLREIPLSRRMLERKFRQRLGRSPLDEIRRAHLERAKHLLATTGLSLEAIAEQSGFGRAEQLCVTFRKQLKQTPTAYRKQFLVR